VLSADVGRALMGRRWRRRSPSSFQLVRKVGGLARAQRSKRGYVHRSSDLAGNRQQVGHCADFREAQKGPLLDFLWVLSSVGWHCMCKRVLQIHNSCMGWYLHQCISPCVGDNCRGRRERRSHVAPRMRTYLSQARLTGAVGDMLDDMLSKRAIG